MIEKQKTNIFTLYERGKNYNRNFNLYEEGTDNYNYYHGRQWEDLEKPNINSKAYTEPVVLNIIKPIVKYKVNIVNQYSYQIVFNPNTYGTLEELETLSNTTRGLTQFVNRMWEKSQSGKKVRSIVKNACINSQGIIHFFNEGDDINSEEIDKNNFYLGNENDSDLQNQPYILCVFRKTVREVQERAKKYREAGLNKLTDQQISNIVEDMEHWEQAGNKYMNVEVSPMCLVVQMYERREDGKIWVSEATQSCELLQPQTTKCELYPFAHFLWEEEKGYARGVSEVKGLIANQREINKTATRRAIAVRIGAYPKLAYSKKYISDPRTLSQVGTPIGIDGAGASDVNKFVSYLKPATMSGDAYNLQQDLIQGTRDLAGAGDTVTGQVDPTQASGKAILAVQQASQQPLNEQVENYKYFLEDCAKIIFEMIKVYYVDGLTLYSSEETVNELGQTESLEKPFKLNAKQLEALDVDMKIDITNTSPYSKYTQEMSLLDLLGNGQITLEEFTEALPEDSSLPKPDLETIIKKRKEARKQITMMQQEMNAMASAINQVAIEEGGFTGDEMSQMPNSGDASNQGGGQQNPPQM